MSAKKRALGRGLDSLLNTPAGVDDEPEQSESSQQKQVVDLPLSDIHPNHNQPRSQFDEELISELCESIREKGILQPLLVRKDDAGYEIVAGERRYRAAKQLELEVAPCLIVQVTDEASLEIALIENIQREDLNAVEEARAYQSLMEQFNLSQEEVASRVGKARATVTNSLRLLRLPLDIQEDMLNGKLSAGHARAILALEEPAKQRHLRNLVLSKGLSVRQAEAQARELTKNKKRKPPKPREMDAQMRSLQEEFSMRLGLPVFIKAVTSQAGKIEIQYHNLDDFEVITTFFGIETQ